MCDKGCDSGWVKVTIRSSGGYEYEALRRCSCNPAPPPGAGKPRRRRGSRPKPAKAKQNRFCRCGQPKRPIHMLCKECYAALSGELRLALWADQEEELRQAYSRACAYLDAHPPSQIRELLEQGEAMP